MASISARPTRPRTRRSPASATIAIVTYNRSGLLTKLLESITAMDPKPGHVVIVDNASTDDTTAVVESFRERLGAELVYRRLDENTGGSGGFSEGMRVAYELGSTWIWLMDDDVEVLPDGLAKMGAWAPRFKSIQGRRYDFDGSEFYWQYRVAEPLAIPIPFAPSGFDESGYKEMNSGCFEGMFIHRDIVGQIGLPDPALLHLLGRPDLRLARVAHHHVGHRERVRAAPHARDQAVGHGHPAHERVEQRVPLLHHAQPRDHQALLPEPGVYNPVLFGFGTALTFGKELIRLSSSSAPCGTSNLFRGLRDGRKISRDAAWKPMPPLVAAGWHPDLSFIRVASGVDSRALATDTRALRARSRSRLRKRAACTASRAWTSLRESST
jgi:hypothetical protein